MLFDKKASSIYLPFDPLVQGLLEDHKPTKTEIYIFKINEIERRNKGEE